jgi:hypothetical protein
MKTTGLSINSGLGNQLFMIFALISYCIDNLTNYVIYYDETKMRTYWDTILDSFKDYIRNEKDMDKSLTVYEEPHFHYKTIPEISGDFLIKGYCQSDKYFKHNFQTIKSIMKLEEKQQNVKDEYGVKYFTKRTIALHFRIGDYVGLQGFHCIKQPKYYINSITKMIEQLKDKDDNISKYDILYFCQHTDNHIVNQYLAIFRETFKDVTLNFVKIDDNISDWKQLLIMSQCDHFIIANSTFSWFGAYLSDNYHNKHNAIVCYPHVWFGPYYASHNTSDLCPTDWIAVADQ